MNIRDTSSQTMREIQDRISTALAEVNGAPFSSDNWSYDGKSGGGESRIFKSGELIESGGVNFSAIEGDQLPESALAALDVVDPGGFFATGVSIVIHPHNPFVPTIHMNVRYFESDNGTWWFGGGIDLTPYYPDEPQAVEFHRVMKSTCDRFDASWYPRFKKQCDEYFYLPHRNETRGIGGIFYDHHKPDPVVGLEFSQAVGEAFLEAWLPIAAANRDKKWTPEQRRFQLLRRGRYVEFNLLFDRGTRFGIQSGGRTESILMSLPSEANWAYDWRPEPGSPEDLLLTQFLKPRDWLKLD